MREAVGRLPEGVFRAQRVQITAPTIEQTFPAPEDVKPNAYALVNGAIAIRDGDQMRVLSDLNRLEFSDDRRVKRERRDTSVPRPSA